MDSKTRTIDFGGISKNIYYQNNNLMFLRLKKILDEHHFSISRIVGSKKNQDLLAWINTQLPQLQDSTYLISTKLYWIIHGLIEFPRCQNPECNKPLGIGKNVKLYDGYNKHCDERCSSLDPKVQSKNEKTCLKNFGYEHPMQSPEKKQQSKQTRLKKYGNENYTNIEQAKQTCLQKYGHENPAHGIEAEKKRHETFLRKFGTYEVLASPIIVEKSRQTFRRKYNVDSYTQTTEYLEKTRKTCNEKFGCDHPMQNAVFRRKSQSKYAYDGHSFDSSPELALYIYLQDHKIPFTYQPETNIWYEYGGKKHNYCPDFLIEDQLYEIKGNQFLKEDRSWQNPYDHTQDELYEAKHQCCIKHNVVILFEDSYQVFLDYCQSKYLSYSWSQKFKKDTYDEYQRN